MQSAPVAVLLVLDLLLLLIVLGKPRTEGKRSESALVAGLFLCSGIPALIYQIVWQRALFLIYGVNVQSVAVVVSAFMLGLGIGSLIGGALSQRFPRNGILIFGGCELGIAVFGLNSLRLFHWAASYTAGASLGLTVLYSFLLLIVPTVLMGATLPLLVEQLVKSSRNVGYSVASLYFVNTFGSALACYLCAVVLMNRMGETGSVQVAACMNALVGATAYLYGRLRRTEKQEESAAEITTRESQPEMSLGFAAIVAGLAGFLALGFEIAWFRLFAMGSFDRAPAFALLLSSYLAGIAAGSFVSEAYTEKRKLNPLSAAGFVMLLAGAISVYLGPAMGAVAERGWQVIATAPMVFLIAGLLGSVMPLLCRSAVAVGDAAGRGVSLIYVSNIVGSTLGSLVIGFVLLNRFGGEAIALQLAAATVLTGFAILWRRKAAVSAPPRWGWVLAGAAFAAIAVAPYTYHNLYGKLMFKDHAGEAQFLTKYVEENRNGVVLITANDGVYSSGVYDGYFNVDPVNDKNLIFRAYAVALLHPNPRRLLMIGLASGSWAQVLANYPSVETFDIVEINPGYLPLIERYADIRSVLHNPKVHLYIDDGRRWLLAHPEEKYDAIVVNSTFHWRDHSTTLLSVEFLQLIKAHLLPGGVHYYNTTSSRQVFATGLNEFRYGMRVGNFVAVSDSPFELNAPVWIEQLRDFKIDGKLMFDPSTEAGRKTLEAYAVLGESEKGPPREWGLETSDSLKMRLGPQRLITDDNMGEEWSWRMQ